MDRKLKERITGAALLVVLGVVFIPWLLDGRVDPAHSEQSLSIPPPGSGSTDRRTIVLDANRETTVPEASTPQPRPIPVSDEPVRQEPPPVTPNIVPQPVREPATTVARVAEEPPTQAPPVDSAPPPRTETVPTPEPTRSVPKPARTVQPDPTAGWAVQVGSFASQANASKLADALVALEYKAFVSRKMLDGRVMYRVRVGPRATRDEALALAQRLKDDRQPVRVVEHPG